MRYPVVFDEVRALLCSCLVSVSLSLLPVWSVLLVSGSQSYHPRYQLAGGQPVDCGRVERWGRYPVPCRRLSRVCALGEKVPL